MYGQEPPVSASASIEVDGARLWAGASGIAMIIGAVGPWMTIDVVSIDRDVAGVEGTIALVLGVGTLLLALAGTGSAALDVCIGVVAVAIGVRNANRVLGLDLPELRGPGGVTLSIDVGLGWGLVVLIVGGLSLIACAVARTRARRRSASTRRTGGRRPAPVLPVSPVTTLPAEPPTTDATAPGPQPQRPLGPYGR
ncbi:hypothetical protein AB0L40_02445 [Patulibacter sp. NPDC049589]|uniref:hypothetical protein n=1 Tax=Patulibacter sp. NPDC049589 TaxID=3154731 RepID=UPI003435C21D